MARAYKAVLINPDRSCTVHYITKKLKIGPNAFRTKKKSDEVYIIDPAHTISTITKKGFIPFRYTTGYYKRNIPVPVPMEDIHGGTALAEVDNIDIEDPDVLKEINNPENEKKVITVIKPIDVPAFKDWNYNGISSEELGVLFNPQFYSMIAKSNANKKTDQMFLMQIATLGGVGFIAYYMFQNLVPAILKAISGYLKVTGK